jgi:hypothetical protein
VTFDDVVTALVALDGHVVQVAVAVAPAASVHLDGMWRVESSVDLERPGDAVLVIRVGDATLTLGAAGFVQAMRLPDGSLELGFGGATLELVSGADA